MFWQILKQLFPSVSVPSEKYSPRRFAARQNIFHYSPPLQGIIVNYFELLILIIKNVEHRWCFQEYVIEQFNTICTVLCKAFTVMNQ